MRTAETGGVMRTTRCVMIGALVLALAQPRAASADIVPDGSVTGMAVDSAGGAIAGVHIALRSSAIRNQTVSDATGSFEIAPIPPGTYELDASAAGFSPIIGREIGVLIGAPTKIVLVLARAAAGRLATLGTVTVNGAATLSRASAPTTDVNLQTLAAQGATQVTGAIGSQIGVTLSLQNGGAPGLPKSASIRGPDPAETLVDIDGHQVNNTNTGDFALELLDPAEFSGVQIIYGVGPSSLMGANTQGGVINFRTLEPTRETHGLVRFSYGSFNTSGETIEATGSDQRWGYAALYHRYTTQGEVTNFPIVIATPGPGTPAQIAIVGSSIAATTTLAKLRYAIGSGDGYAELSFRELAATRDLSAPLSAPDDPNSTGPNAPFTAINAPGAQAQNTAPAYGIDLQLPLGRHGTDGIAPATITARYSSALSNQSVQNIAPTLNPYLLNTSDRLDDNSLTFERALPNATITVALDVLAERLTAPDVLAPGPPTQQQTQRSAVGRYEWSPTEHLHFTAAAYISDFDTFGWSFDPRIAAVWTPTADTVVRASAGTGFNPPQLTQRVFNPALLPERTANYELGFEHRFGNGALAPTAIANLYVTDLRDSIFFTVGPSGQLQYLKNIGGSVYEGVELRADKPLSASTALHAAYGINVAYPINNPFAYDPSAPNVIAYQQFQGIAPHKWQLSLEHRAQGRGLSYLVAAVGESTNNELNRPAYALVNASIGMSLGRTDISLSGQNLTNQFDDRFTLVGVGTPYPTPTGLAPTDAFSIQGRSVTLALTRHV
jgi:outer membrane receptor protein involved in Fe transport